MSTRPAKPPFTMNKYGIYDVEGRLVTGIGGVVGPTKASAAFIVRAANAHAELVAALKWFIDEIDHKRVKGGFDENVERARAALAAAGRKP